MVAKTTASWKQKRALPPAGAAKLKTRRFWSTFALLASILLVALVITWQFNRYTPRTHLLVVGKSTEEAMALPPVRYVQNSRENLKNLTEKSTHIQVAESSTSFSDKLAAMIAGLKRDDSLIVWLNGSGLTIEKQPLIAGDLFNLADFKNKDHLIDIVEVLQAMSQWTGPKLLLIDWGQETFDPRIELMANHFASELHKVIKSQPATDKSPICVLVSHVDGQISLVDSTAEQAANRQSIFSRAVLEGLLVSERRAPDDPNAAFHIAKRSSSLSIRNFVEYVVRRVKADSYGYQHPWVLVSGKGSLDKLDGQMLDDVAFLSLDYRYGRPLGIAPPSSPPSADKSQGKNESKSDKGSAEDKAANTDLPDLANEPQMVKDLHRMWTTIQQMREPDPKSYNWCYAALSPLAYKQIVAQALDLELRYYASGGSVSGGSVGAESIAQFPQLPPLDYRTKPTPDGDILATDRNQYEATYHKTQIDRMWASIAYDLHKLVGTLGSLSLPEFNPEADQLNLLLAPEAWNNWLSARQRFDQSLNTLTQKIKAAATTKKVGRAAAACEVLLRSNLLTADQRLILRNLQQKKLKLIDPDTDLDKNRELTKPDAETSEMSWALSQGKSSLDATLVEQAKSGQRIAIDQAIQTLVDVDPRDVRVLNVATVDLLSAPNRIAKAIEYPEFKAPQTRELWNIAWDDPSIKADEPIDLRGSKELTLLLTATTANMSFPQVRLQATENLFVSVKDSLLDTTQPLDPSWFSSEKGGLERRLLVKIAKNVDATSSTTGSLEVITDGSLKVGKRPGRLDVNVPVDNPIAVSFYQFYSKNGQADWYPQTNPLRPFAGRESRFQLRVMNRDHRPHHVAIKLYALAENPKGLIGQVHRSEDIEQLLVRQTPTLVWEAEVGKEIDLPNDGMVVKLSAPSNTPPNTPPATAAATPTTPPPDPAAGKLNIRGGLIVATFIDHSAVPLKTRINFAPRRADELIDAEVQMTRDKSLKVTAHWKDGESRDGKAAIAPADLAARPVIIKWDNSIWKHHNVNITSDDIKLFSDSTEPVGFISSPGLEIDGRDKEVWLDVDGTPRSLIYAVVRDSNSPVKLPVREGNGRAHWRSISNKVDDKVTLKYVPFTPPPAKKDLAALIGGELAVFKDLAGVVEVELAVDLPDDDDRFKLRMGSKVHEQLRSRITQCEMLSQDSQLLVNWLERDQVLTFDLSGESPSNDQDYGLIVEGPGVLDSLPTVVADVEPPKFLRAELKPDRVTQGTNTNANLKLWIEDSSQQITVQALVAEGKAVLPFLTMPVTKNGLGRVMFEVPIATTMLPVDTYTFQVKVADRFDHSQSYTLPNIVLKVVAPPPKSVAGGPDSAPEIKGTLTIIAAFKQAARNARNPVTFKVEPPLPNEMRLGDGSISSTEVKAGSYKVTANYSESNKKYAGEKTIILVKPEDFAKPWPVMLELKE